MEITLIYTNWRRNTNLTEIINNTLKQTVLPKIIVVDNAYFDEINRFESECQSIDILKRDNTLMCWERWVTVFNYPSKYVCIMDDDISFSKNNVLYDCYNYMETNINVDCIGVEGVTFIKNKQYVECNHYVASKPDDIKVSMVKGRFMFVRFSSLKNLDLKPDLTCDDIKVSSFLNLKILPSFLNNSFYDLPQGKESLSGKSYQQNLREYARNRYFKNS